MAEDQDSSYLQRLAALDMLRENIFFTQPNKLTASSFAEELPGVFRATAPLIKNVVPSAAIISDDPDERREQIKNALERIRASKKSNSHLGKEILHNMTTMGLGSIPLGFMLSMAFHIAAPRMPYGKQLLYSRDKASPAGWRTPISPIRTIRKMLTRDGYAKNMATHAFQDALVGGGLGATAGAIYPILGKNMHIPDKAFDEASEVLQNEPNITSLPPSEMLSVMKGSPSAGPINTLKNTALGVGAGLGYGAFGALLSTGMKGLGYGAKNVYNKLRGADLTPNVLSRLSRSFLKDLKVALPAGAGLGAISGMATKNLNDYAQQKIDSDQA